MSLGENSYLSYQVEGGVALGSHTCKILQEGCGQEEHYASEISDRKLPWTKVQ